MTVRPGVIYLQKDKFQFFSPVDGKILEFRFGPEIVRDLDVINAALLENLIKSFVTNSRVAPCPLLFVLADNAYFTKDFVMPAHQKTAPNTNQTEVTKELLQKQADEFIEHVPYDNVVSKTLPIKDGLKVFATNKDFYESVAIALEHLGFTIDSVLPGLVLGNGLSLRPSMDSAMASAIIQRVNTVRQYNLLGQQVFQPQIKVDSEEADEVEKEKLLNNNNKPSKKRLFTLVGVFASLIIVLVIVYVQSVAPPTPPKQPALANSPTPSPQISQVLLVTPTIALSSLQTQNLTVQIVDSSSSAPIAKQLMSSLDSFKFKSVSTQTQNAIGSANTLVTFSANTSQDVQNAVLTEVRKVENNVAVQQQQNPGYDITIVLGR